MNIKSGDTYNYIDFLLFNIEYNCYVVIELKITELKKEYIGQIEIYMNYIDKIYKGEKDNLETYTYVFEKQNDNYIFKSYKEFKEFNSFFLCFYV